MRLTLSLLGWELDLSLGPTTTAGEDTGSSLDGGRTASYPVGFVHQWGTPEDVPLPQRTPAWDDEE